MKSKAALLFLLCTLLVSTVLSGCEPTASQKVMMAQNATKIDEAARLMRSNPVPSFDFSVERQNIVERLVETNNPTNLAWIYILSNGKVMGRFPLRGKVTSGSKRLTSTSQLMPFAQGDGTNATVAYHIVESPDEMGTYGASNPYIFWFDPSGHYNQLSSDSYVSSVPYLVVDHVITSDIDTKEENKRELYQKQMKEHPIKIIEQVQPITDTVKK
jgi:hypothetical protein